MFENGDTTTEIRIFIYPCTIQVSNEPGMRYNISMINALVMYVGTQAIQYIRGKNNSPSMSSIAHSSHMDIFQVKYKLTGDFSIVIGSKIKFGIFPDLPLKSYGSLIFPRFGS